MRTFKYHIFILLFLCLFHPVFCQSIFKIGPELGLTFTGSQKGLSYIDPTAKLTELTSPLIGAKFGFTFLNHIDLLTGFKFENIGYQTRVETGYYGPHIEGTRYSKLCFPVQAGIILGTSKIRPAFYLGYVLNHLCSGTLKSDKEKYDLFDPEFNDIHPERNCGQFMVGFSGYIGNLAVNASYLKGGMIEWGRHDHGHHDRPPGADYFFPFRNREFCISVNYFFNFIKREE